MSLDNYEDVDTRIHRFYEKHPTGRILTELVHVERAPNGSPIQYVTRAEVYTDQLIASGYAEELVGSSKVNTTSALENCETSAIGRALANAGFSPKGSRPSAQEMGKVERVKVSHSDQTIPDDPWASANAMATAVETVTRDLGAVRTSMDTLEGPAKRAANSTGSVSTAQMGFLNKLMPGFEYDLPAVNALLERGNRTPIESIEALTKNDASFLITALKGGGA